MTCLISLVVCLVATLGPITDQPVVYGIVTDADTGAPVARFRVVPGGNTPGDRLILFHNLAQDFGDGHYIFTERIPTADPVVRIEADGYAPVTSNVLDLTRDVEFDIELRRAPNIQARVLTPDGNPAAAADVLLAASFTQISLKNERFDDQAFTFCPRSQTDHTGRFVFWPVEEDFRVLVLHDSGWVELSRDEMKLLDPIVLLPWAKIEGVLCIGPAPAAGERISIQWINPAGVAPSGGFHRQYDVQTDELGRFSFARLPAGEGTIGRYLQIGPYRGYGLTGTRRFALEPGQTLHIDIGGEGRPVVGRFEAPDGLRQDWMTYARLSTKPAEMRPPSVPDEIQAQGPERIRQWQQEYRQTDEYKAQQAAIERDRRTHRHYAFPVNRDGSFRIEDVVAGTYVLTLSATARTSDDPPRIVQAATARAEVTVPDIPGGRSDEPLDLGIIEVELTEPR